MWDRAEAALEKCLQDKGLQYRLQPGEGAFYGPKIEFTLLDSIDRAWQCGTIQLDFSMPGRLGADFVGEDGAKHVPVMVHRAILGSLERFIGILIENYAGKLPVWLSPVQVAVMNITDAQADRVRAVQQALQAAGLRAIADLRNEKIGFKIREQTLQRIPYQLIIGDRELQTGQVAVRTRSGDDLGAAPIEQFVARVQAEVAARTDAV